MSMGILAAFAAIGAAFVVLVLVSAAMSAISASLYQFSGDEEEGDGEG